MFVRDREAVLTSLERMGAACCSYSHEEWSRRCDCKYDVTVGKWPTANETGNGCPELRAIHGLVSAMTDAEWAMLVDRGGNAPSGAATFAASPEQLEHRLRAAHAAADMAAANIGKVRGLLSLEPDPLSSSPKEKEQR
jgi:hypothetical protein